MTTPAWAITILSIKRVDLAGGGGRPIKRGMGSIVVKGQGSAHREGMGGEGRNSFVFVGGRGVS